MFLFLFLSKTSRRKRKNSTAYFEGTKKKNKLVDELPCKRFREVPKSIQSLRRFLRSRSSFAAKASNIYFIAKRWNLESFSVLVGTWATIRTLCSNRSFATGKCFVELLHYLHCFDLSGLVKQRIGC